VKKNYYTFLIIPQKESSIRKFKLSGTFVNLVSFAALVFVLSLAYFVWEHIHNVGKIEELNRLRQVNAVQREQIDVLAGKVGEFEQKLSNLRQFDKKLRIITNLDNKGKDSQLLGVGGPSQNEGGSESQVREIEDELIDQIHKNMDELLDEATFQESSFQELYNYLQEQKSVLASTPSIWPVMGWVTSRYGYRTSPFTGKREFHRGIDISARVGEPVVAPADGTVVKACRKSDMGNMITIDHGNGIVTSYGHLLKLSTIKRGQNVKRGEVIGYVGNSGRSTGPHLHYGVRVDGIHVNPQRYLF
jgi:murein DD-endopeptidase MepM/ murein hydrolase activator NlpD